MSPGPLEALLEELHAGNLDAVEQLFRTYETSLRLIVRRRLSQRLRAKFDSLDVVQSVWVRVLRDLPAGTRHLTSEAHLRNFLIRVTRNCLTDRLRHYRTPLAREEPLAEAGAESLPSHQPRPSETARANELWQALLAVCPPEHHELLRLKRDGLPLAAIASRTGLHEDSVRRILRRLARQVAFPADELML